MKIAISFIAGIIVSSLIIVFGVKAILPIKAETDNMSEQTENLTRGLLDLLPDFEKIYRESLTAPFRKAESKIYDPEIAEFYRELLDSTGLRGTEDGG